LAMDDQRFIFRAFRYSNARPMEGEGVKS